MELLVVMSVAVILLTLATSLFRQDTLRMNLPVAASRLEQFLDQAGSLARARGQAVGVLLADLPGDPEIDGRHLRLAVPSESPAGATAGQGAPDNHIPPVPWQWTGHEIDLPQGTRLVVESGLPARELDRPSVGDTAPVWRQIALITPEGREQGAGLFEVRRVTATSATEADDPVVIRLRLNALGRLSQLPDEA